MDKKIEKVWFDNNRIYILTSDGAELSRPLEAFPLLLAASDAERMNFTIGKFGDDIRWPGIDEDIHISSFYDTLEPSTDNEVAKILGNFPWISRSEIAKEMNIHPAVLTLYYFGMKQPSEERLNSLRSVIHSMGERMITI